MSSLFRDEASKAKVRAWHDRFRAKLRCATTSREVPTRFGKTHLLQAGDASAPPLVLLHGAMASSAHLLGELEVLAERFHVHAVDVIGQSVMSEDARLGVKGDEAGRWLVDVLDALGLARVRLLGVSWGGFVAQRFAAVAPERLEKLALLVPAGMVSGSAWAGFVKMGLPMATYLFGPNPQRLQRLGAALLTTLDDDWLPFIGDAFLAYDVKRMEVPRLSRSGEFAALRAPVLVIGADEDVSFPGAKVVARAKELFPTLEAAELLQGVKHSPPTTPEFRAELGARLLRFFT